MRRWLFLLAPSLCCHRISHSFRTVIPASFVQPWIIIVELITYLELAYVPSALDILYCILQALKMLKRHEFCYQTHGIAFNA